jgi:hypothetical protein
MNCAPTFVDDEKLLDLYGRNSLRPRDQGRPAALQEAPLGGVLGAGDGSVVRLGCFGVSAQATQQVGADRVIQVIAAKVEVVQKSER